MILDLSTLQSFRGQKPEEEVKRDLSALLFRHRKTQQACRIFLEWLNNQGHEVSPSELSQFARDLQAGRFLKGFTYRRASFYSVVLKRLLDLSFISKQTRYPQRIVYAPVLQPIPKRAPLVDVADRGDHYAVSAELPGYKKEC